MVRYGGMVPTYVTPPPIRYGDTRCHQAFGLQHFEAGGRKTQHTTTIDQVRGQSKTKENAQRRLLTQAAGVIYQLATALHTSLQATSDNTYLQATLDNNMRHPTGESTLSLSESIACPSPPSRQPAVNKSRVAHKDLSNMLPAKPELLDLDNENSIDDWDSESDADLEQAAQMLDDLCNNNEHDKEMLVEQNTVSTPESTPVVGQMATKVEIPPIMAPTPTRVNKIVVEAEQSNTREALAANRKSWLSANSSNNIEKALVRGRCALCNFQANEPRRTKLHIR